MRFPESCLQAGRDAYRLGVHIRNNPYRNNGKPFWELWEKGYKAECRLLEAHQEGDPFPAQLPPFTCAPHAPDVQKFNRTLVHPTTAAA